MLEPLQSRLAAYYAEHNGEQPVSIGPLVVLTSGWSGGVYSFTVDESAAFVLKTFAPTPVGRENATREWQALSQLGSVNYSVPQVIHFESDTSYLGRPFLVMEKVAGEPLWYTFEHSDQANQERLLDLFVKALVDLHAIDPHILAPTLSRSNPYESIDRELEGLRESSQRSKYPTLAGVVTWLEQHKQAARCHQPAILHRDYHPWNVLLDTNERLTVIDWDWSIGDFRFDVAWTSTLMGRSNFHSFSSNFEAEYTRQSGRPLDELTYFKVLTTLRWLFNVTRGLEPEVSLRDAGSETFKEFLVEPVRHAVAFIQNNTGVTIEVTL